jgi:hypothetical protein
MAAARETFAALGAAQPASALRVPDDPVIVRRGFSEFPVASKQQPKSRLAFKRHGLSWKLNGVDLPPDQTLPAAPQAGNFGTCGGFLSWRRPSWFREQASPKALAMSVGSVRRPRARQVRPFHAQFRNRGTSCAPMLSRTMSPITRQSCHRQSDPAGHRSFASSR